MLTLQRVLQNHLQLMHTVFVVFRADACMLYYAACTNYQLIVSFVKVATVGTSKFDTQLPLAARDSKGKLKFRTQRYIRFPDVPLTLIKGLKVLVP
jgi:hypothetical protein